MFRWGDSWSTVDCASWQALLAEQQRPSPFLSPGFCLSWARHFAGPLRLGRYYSDSNQRLDGLVFFHQTPNGDWQLVGGQDVADRLGALIRPDLESQFWQQLFLETRSWQAKIDFPNIDSQDSLLSLPATVAVQTDVAPFVELTSFDEYLANLTKKQRHELRRKRRRLGDSTSSQLLWVQTPQQLSQMFPEFCRLHRLSHPEKENFMTASMEDFFSLLLRQMAEEGRLQLAFLLQKNQAMASMLHFKSHPSSGGSLELYNSGFDPQFRELAPGFVLLSYCIEWACTQRIPEYNFLRGNERYKYDLGGRDRLVYRAHWPAGHL